MKATKDDIIILKENILELVYKKKEGHIASAFSILDIIWILYHDVMNIFKDEFILSKGHGSLALYATLNELGILESNEFESFCDLNSPICGHPTRDLDLMITASTGSLGHGLPIAVGMALASKIRNTDEKIYCLIGDGESNEGTTWESCLLANQYNLNNLCCIVDNNHSNDRAINIGDYVSKFKSFGWDCDIIDGHNHTLLFQSLCKESNKPRAIIAETIKGKGCKTMENNPEWHHKIPNKEEYKILLNELRDEYEKTIYTNSN